MRRFVAILATVFTLSPMTAFAAPASVAGIRAQQVSDGISVSWTASSDPNVSYYRVYWSRQSILQNGGRWDDFETTPGKETTHVLKGIPQAPSVWVAVMAVNSFGEESPVFTEEVEVKLSGTTQSAPRSSTPASSATVSSTPVSSTPSSATPTITAFELQKAEAVSATGVLLTFSTPVTVAREEAARAFLILDQSGALLQIRRLVLQGQTVLLVTLPQRRDLNYTVSAGNVLKTTVGNLPLNPAKSQLSFHGHPDGITKENAETMNPPTLVQEVSHLRLQGEQKEDGSYTVTAEWDPRDPESIFAYQIRQTRDGGKTWSAAQNVPTNTTSVRIANVPPGSFGILVRIIGKNGLISTGTFGSIELPKFDANGNPIPPVQGSVTNPPDVLPPKTPNAGPSDLFAFMLAGAGAAMFEMKRRELKTKEVLV